MEFTSFKTLVRDEVAKRTGEQYHVRINEVMKNNRLVLDLFLYVNKHLVNYHDFAHSRKKTMKKLFMVLLAYL